MLSSDHCDLRRTTDLIPLPPMDNCQLGFQLRPAHSRVLKWVLPGPCHVGCLIKTIRHNQATRRSSLSCKGPTRYFWPQGTSLGIGVGEYYHLYAMDGTTKTQILLKLTEIVSH